MPCKTIPAETGIAAEAEAEVEAVVPAEPLTLASRRAEIDLVILSTHRYSGLRHARSGLPSPGPAEPSAIG